MFALNVKMGNLIITVIVTALQTVLAKRKKNKLLSNGETANEGTSI